MINEKTKELIERYRAMLRVIGNKDNPELYDISKDIINSININKLSNDELLLFSGIMLDLSTTILLLKKVNSKNSKPKTNKK